MENMIAVERGSWSQWGAKNLLVPSDWADHYRSKFWAVYNRINYIDVFDTVLVEAKNKDRYIGVEYHTELEFGDSYVGHLSIDSALSILLDKSNFVFKFQVLSEALTEEYKLYGV